MRWFAADEIDVAKRQLGQTKDLAHGPQAPEVRARVLAPHGQGHGPCHIARETRLSRKRVARVLASEGIRRQPLVPASCLLPEVLKLRRQGKSNFEIGQAPGFSRNAVRRAFRAHKD
jgi:hypothetical protein